MHTQTAALVAQLQAFHLGSAVEPALQLTIERNEGRLRPLSDQPYLYHVVEVATHIVEVFGIRDETATVLALWHDLLEDEQITPDELTVFINQHPALMRLGAIMPLLDGLNRHGKTTEQYYETIGTLPPQVFWVKAADLLSNTKMMPLLDWPRLKPHWIAKYTVELAREVLDVGRFERRRGYTAIRTALLDVQQRLLNALANDAERWREVAAHDPRFGAAATALLQAEIKPHQGEA